MNSGDAAEDTRRIMEELFTPEELEKVYIIMQWIRIYGLIGR